MEVMGGFPKCCTIILLTLSSFLIRSSGYSQQVNSVPSNLPSTLTEAELQKFFVPKLTKQNMDIDRQWSEGRHLYIGRYGRKNGTRTLRKRSAGRRRILHPTNGRRKKDILSDETLLNMAAENTGNPCVVDPCQHGGTCIWKRNQIPNFICDCVLGYTGSRCQEELPECDTAPCRDHGDCVATRKGFVCICKGGFKGRLCEKRNGPGPVADTPSKDNEIHIAIKKENVIVGEYALASVTVICIMITVIVCIHCCRVNIKQNQQRKECEEKLLNGETVTSLPPGICEVSNQICTETFCCSFCPCVENEDGRQTINLDKLLQELKFARFQLASTQKQLRKQSLESVNQRQGQRGSLSSAEGLVNGQYLAEMPHGRQIQSERYISPSKPSIRSFRSLPAQLTRPHERYSWMRSASDEEQLVNQSPVLPEAHSQLHGNVAERHYTDTGGLGTRNDYPSTDFVKNGSNISQHSVYSERSRDHPPLPPLPPHAH